MTQCLNRVNIFTHCILLIKRCFVLLSSAHLIKHKHFVLHADQCNAIQELQFMCIYFFMRIYLVVFNSLVSNKYHDEL